MMRLKSLWVDGFKNLNNFQINFEVEDYFPIDVLKDFIFTKCASFQDLKGKFDSKRKIDFEVANFNGFKVLFDKILKIKNSS